MAHVRSHHVFRALMLALVLVIVAACGNGTEDSADQDDGEPTPATGAEERETEEEPDDDGGQTPTDDADDQAQEDGPIVIGVISSLSGPIAGLGAPAADAIRLYVDRINEAGGVDGREIELVVEDDRTNPSEAVLALQRLLDRGIDALVGPISSTSSLAIIPEMESAGIPMVTMAAAIEQVEPIRANVFMTAPTTDVIIRSLLGHISECAGAEEIALVRDNEDYGVSGSRVIGELVDEFGLTLVAEEEFNREATDLSSQIARVQDAEKIIFYSGTRVDITFAKQLNSLGMGDKAYYTLAATPLFLDPVGSEANGALTSSSMTGVAALAGVPEGIPNAAEIQEYLDAYREEYGDDPPSVAGNGYDATMIVVEAMRRAGTTAPDEVVAEIEAGEFVGVQGVHRFSADQHAGLGNDSQWIAEIQDGTVVPHECQFGH